MRYFYDDPIVAIYMVKHFALELYCVVNPEDPDYDEDEKIEYPFLHASISTDMWGDVLNEPCRSIYISEECLSILDPQIDDVCLWDLGSNLTVILVTPELIKQNGFISIIQRNEIAFIYPKVENEA